MKIKKREKRGISLIVLVITIIIMIILATAIILSLNNSGIIGNAKEATRASDEATAKNVAAIASGEWELLNEKGTAGLTDKKTYIENALREQGFTVGDKIAVTDKGEIVTGNAANAITKGLKIGDYVAYMPTTVTSTKYKTYGSETYFATQADLRWQYMGMNDSGNVIIVADKATTGNLNLSGKEGYLQGPTQLNDLCKELYSSEKGTGRSINVDDINSVLNYTGSKGTYYNSSGTEKKLIVPETIGKLAKNESNTSWLVSAVTPDGKDIKGYKVDYYDYVGTKYKTSETVEYKLIFKVGDTITNIPAYWLAAPCIYVNFDGGYAYFNLRCVANGNVMTRNVFNGTYRLYYAVRPVVTLKSNIQIGDKVGSGEWQLN